MADVVMVCVREDVGRAEQLADMFDDFGFSVSCDASDDALARCGAGVVVWTDAATASPALKEAIARVMASGKGVAVTFAGADAPPGAALAFDLTGWSGDPEDPALDPMFFALDRMVVAARAARPVLRQLAEKADARGRVAAPAPAVPSSAPPPRMRTMAASLAVLGLVIAGAVGLGRAPEAPAPAVVVSLPAAPDEAPRVALADARALDMTYDLAATPVEDATVGRRGFEPPSAAGAGRSGRTPAPVRSWDRPTVSPVPAAFSTNPTGSETPEPARSKPGA